MILTIVRVENTSEVTRGVMLVDRVVKFVTLEEPWRDNEKKRSCIPTGVYHLSRRNSQKYGIVYDVLDVPGRSAIICPHVGNTVKDTEGCVILGLRFGEISGLPAVLDSKMAMRQFRKVATADKGILEIIEVKMDYSLGKNKGESHGLH